MPLLLRTHYRLAYDSIHQNRTRSFLTCLGIAIGVAAIVLILSLTGSIQNIISSQVTDTGSDLIVIRPSSSKDTTESIIEALTSSNQYLKSNLNLEDVETISKINNVKSVSEIAKSELTVSADRIDDSGKAYTSTIDSAPVVATNPTFIDIQKLTLSSGTFLTNKNQHNTAVVGRDLSLRLFGTTEPVGKTLTILGQKFIVIGVLTETDDQLNFMNINFNNSIFVNADYLNTLDNNLQIQQINVRANSKNDLPKLSAEISEKLKESKNGDTNFSVTYGDQISHPTSGMLTIISGMLTLVASISLIVGGIGVMNIMLVSVTERTHEIGIRKAVGATSGNILLQFLFEALILSSLGGLGGLILGYVLAFLLSVITSFAPYIDLNIIGITLATSVTVGLIFGIYPALKAARKNPIDSLRYSR